MILTIANAKGGTGKSTTAMFLAAAFARDEKTVLVIDTDPRTGGTAYSWSEAAKGGNTPLPFEVIHRPVSQRDLDTDTGIFSTFTQRALFYDVVLIDTQSSSTAAVVQATKDADFTIVPCTNSPVDLTPTLAAAKRITTPHAVVLTRTGSDPEDQQARSFFNDRGEKVLTKEILERRQNFSAAYASDFGEDLFGYSQLAQEIEESLASADLHFSQESGSNSMVGRGQPLVKVGVRLPAKLHHEAKAKLAADGITMQDLLQQALVSYVSSSPR